MHSEFAISLYIFQVLIYADVVFNSMASESSNSVGTAGTSFDGESKIYMNYIMHLLENK